VTLGPRLATPLQLFAHYDADRSGSLRPAELSRLCRDLLPDVSRSELHYFVVRSACTQGAQRSRCDVTGDTSDTHI
jgi:hypothetical protein